MAVAYVVITIVGAAMVGFSATSVFFHAKWVVAPLADYGVPRRWWPWLGTAKALGAVGLIVGLIVPIIGAIAAIAVVLYFVGAVFRWTKYGPPGPFQPVLTRRGVEAATGSPNYAGAEGDVVGSARTQTVEAYRREVSVIGEADQFGGP
jgi:hypothetical protein